MRFDPKLVREIMWQGMTEEEPSEEVFDEAGRSCVRLLWAALASKFGRKRRRRLRRVMKQPLQT